jgi:hypothetical protein
MEKVVENVIEDLLTQVLDWPLKEIAYQSGRADMVASKDGRVQMILEAKSLKDDAWQRQDMIKALHQAHGYASAHQAGVVVVSDGRTLYAETVSGEQAKPLCFIALDISKSDESLWWLSRGGIEKAWEGVREGFDPLGLVGQDLRPSRQAIEEGRFPAHGGLFQVASAHDGYFTLEEAQKAGFSARLISYHCRTGRFYRVAEGVYRFRDYPEPYSDIMVAWLLMQRRAGRAIISHETALSLHQLSDLVPRAIDITIDRQSGHLSDGGSLPGVRIHTTKTWPEPNSITTLAGVESTDVKRTLVDCIIWGTESGMVRQAIQEATRQGLVSTGQLRAEALGRDKIGAREMVERALRSLGREEESLSL